MRGQICRVLIALGCAIGLSVPALAGPSSCTPGSLLSTLTLANFTGTLPPYGEVCVTLIDSTHAAIKAETFDDFVMFGAGAFGLNVNSTGFIIVGGDPGIIGGTSPSATIAFPGGTEDGFGRFD